MLIREKAASIAPAAVNVCPIMDLFELIGVLSTASPITVFSDRYSILSFS